MNARPLLTLCMLLGLTACGSTATPRSAAPLPETSRAELPVRPELRDYRLPNGLRVMLVPRQTDGVELRLLVASGSLQESAQQRGLAHFVEHMAFKGSRNFPGKAGLAALERLGMSLGPDINAATSFNSTLYKISLADNDTAHADLALRLMADWASQLSFDPAAFEAEREVIVEEWRLRQGVGQRINQQLDDLLYQDSDYQQRSPIGDLEVIRHAPLEQAQAFYRDWYQPQRMTLLLVGRFDEAQLRQRIDTLFSSQPRGTAPAASTAQFRDTKALRVASVFDAEQSQRLLQLVLQRNLPAMLDSQNGQWRDLIDALWLSVLDERLDLLVEQGLFSQAGVSERATLLDARRGQYRMLLHPRDGNYAKAAELLFTELQRMAQHPVSVQELEAAKQRLQEKLEQQAAGQQRYANQVLADGLAQAVEFQMPLFDKRQQWQITQTWLPTIGVLHLQAAVSELLAEASPRLALVGPQGDTSKTYDNQWAAHWHKALSSQPGPFPYTAKTQQLTLQTPVQGSLSKTAALPEVGAVQWHLGNGLRIIVKADSALQDNVRLELRQSGGTSLEDSHQAGLSNWATGLAERSGYGNYSALQLARLGQASQVQLQPFSESLFHGMRGSAPADQLEPLFKLLHLKLSAPRFDPQRLDEMRQRYSASLDNMPGERRFMDAINRTAYSNGERLVSDARGPWRDFNAEQLRQAYQGLFGIRQGMTLVVSGPVDPARLEQLSRTWLASLPTAPGPLLHWRDLGVQPLQQSLQKQYAWSSSPKTMVNLLYSNPAQWRAEDVLALQLVDKVANQRLRQAIRDEASGVYAIGFSQLLARLPSAYYLARLNFTASPERAEALTAKAQTVLGELAEHGISQAELQQARQALLNEQTQQRRSATYWSETLAQVAMVDNDFRSLAQAPERLHELDLSRVNGLCRQLLGGHPKLFVLTPERANLQATGTSVAQ
ncbi:M16 family metallopeptidase [Pseudomonas rubra]|uniref:Insulinase family protein n=1 Tax=Pseudomonas rubra TaxID=2942627 RepID=A0ABT5P5U0_9PSED|nr:M16 family metallopeptidase [Pseudomonas rubra]MDD1013664.1 insulinase family protein [Pseudomonas rubra]MDD1040017.1 insulinase family protein [Pseudomonas rubra]MDD1155977.1 insulinase family protein [Pseudomonas rubra]